MAKIETLVKDIHELFSSDSRIAGDAYKGFAESVGKRIATKISEHKSNPSLRLSNLGIEPRRLWYSINRPELAEALPPEARLKYLFGDIIEELILWLAREAGHAVSREQETVEVNGVLGHIDAIIDGWVIDVKSASSYSFTKFTSGSIFQDDAFGYIPQLDCYRTALRTPGLRAAWVVLDKSLGKLAFIECPIQGVNWDKYVDETREMLAKPTPPERGYKLIPEGTAGNMKLPIPCQYCDFKKTCYPGLRTFSYYKGPMHLAVVKKLPNVPEIK